MMLIYFLVHAEVKYCVLTIIQVNVKQLILKRGAHCSMTGGWPPWARLLLLKLLCSCPVKSCWQRRRSLWWVCNGYSIKKRFIQNKQKWIHRGARQLRRDQGFCTQLTCIHRSRYESAEVQTDPKPSSSSLCLILCLMEREPHEQMKMPLPDSHASQRDVETSEKTTGGVTKRLNANGSNWTGQGFTERNEKTRSTDLVMLVLDQAVSVTLLKEKHQSWG